MHTAGVWNAVAFWFDLQLDEETSLSTSPYSAKVTGARFYGVAANNAVAPAGIVTVRPVSKKTLIHLLLRCIDSRCINLLLIYRRCIDLL